MRFENESYSSVRTILRIQDPDRIKSVSAASISAYRPTHPVIPSDIVLRDYQVAAIESWFSQWLQRACGNGNWRWENLHRIGRLGTRLQ